MGQRLNNFNPKTGDEPVPAKPRDLPAAIPIQFDAVLTRTPDHGAARAVERELTRQGIRFFRTEGAGPANRVIELHVATSDHARASQLAAMIFLRRRRLDQISPRRPPSDDSLIPPGGAGDGFPGIM